MPGREEQSFTLSCAQSDGLDIIQHDRISISLHKLRFQIANQVNRMVFNTHTAKKTKQSIVYFGQDEEKSRVKKVIVIYKKYLFYGDLH